LPSAGLAPTGFTASFFAEAGAAAGFFSFAFFSTGAGFFLSLIFFAAAGLASTLFAAGIVSAFFAAGLAAVSALQARPFHLWLFDFLLVLVR
jgi:hypothetical protein